MLQAWSGYAFISIPILHIHKTQTQTQPQPPNTKTHHLLQFEGEKKQKKNGQTNK